MFCEICNIESTKEICDICEATRPQDCIVCGEIAHGLTCDVCAVKSANSAKQACPICECLYGEESDVCSGCSAEMEWQIESEVEPCLYCDCMVTPLDGKQAATIGWDLVGEEHTKNCEWVLTQAHTLN
jgi:hypothetical protein